VAQPIRNRTRLARGERREQIVRAAARVFDGRDPAEVTFEEIADAAGVSRALVYNYFGDRHGLLEAVYRTNVDRLQREVSEAMASKSVRRDALKGAVFVHLEFASRDPVGYRYAAGSPTFTRLPELQQERVGSIARNIGGDRTAFLVAQGILSALQSMVLHWLDEGEPDREETCDIITTLLWDGLAGMGRAGLQFTPSWTPPPAP
jgi:AcrR family transcriptional regulator